MRKVAMVSMIFFLSVLAACSYNAHKIEDQVFLDETGNVIGAYSNGIIKCVGYGYNCDGNQEQEAREAATLTLLGCLNKLAKGKAYDFSGLNIQKGNVWSEDDGTVVCTVYAQISQGGELWRQ